MLSCSNIHKAYGANRVLRGISARFRAGTITSIIGPSGTGKSTFLRILSMLEAADQGAVTFGDVTVSFPVAEETPAKVNPWPRLTTVFQQLFLWPHLSIRQNICLPVRNTDKTKPGGFVDQIMRDLMVTEFAGRYPNEVSHGQRQRAAIARAIALEPDFMLLDEITSALDVEHVGIVLDYLQRLRDQGVGIVLITHLIGFARDAADQVVFMEHGNVVEAGPASILGEPKTTRLRDFLSLVAQRSKGNQLLQSEYVLKAIRDHGGHSDALPNQLASSSPLILLAKACHDEARVSSFGSLADDEADFVATTLLLRLRTGNLPAEKDASAINRYPFVDALRMKVEETDLFWILSAIEPSKPELAGLLISLLRKFDTREEVVASLRSAWRTGSPLLKAHLLWRLLDAPDLRREQKQEVFDFILDHWEVFNRVSAAFLGPPETIIPNALKRLADPTFPSAKKWAYLCRVIDPAPDKGAAEALLALHLNHEDEFMRHTARTLLDRFFGEPETEDPKLRTDAQGLLDAMRTGWFPDEIEAGRMDRLPMIGYLRTLVEAHDIQWLTKPVPSECENLQGLFVSLLRNIRSNPSVASFLEELWPKASTHVRTRLLYRLADDSALSEDWKRRLFEFILTETEAFAATCRSFYGGEEEARKMLFERLADPAFPSTKRWLYLSELLVCARSSSDWPREDVKYMLQICQRDSDDFTREVANHLASHFEV